MDLLTIFIVCIIVGVALWLVNAYVPMDPKVKQILNIAVVIVLVIWLLSAILGGGHHLGRVRVG